MSPLLGARTSRAAANDEVMEGGHLLRSSCAESPVAQKREAGSAMEKEALRKSSHEYIEKIMVAESLLKNIENSDKSEILVNADKGHHRETVLQRFHF